MRVASGDIMQDDESKTAAGHSSYVPPSAFLGGPYTWHLGLEARSSTAIHPRTCRLILKITTFDTSSRNLFVLDHRVRDRSYAVALSNRAGFEGAC